MTLEDILKQLGDSDPKSEEQRENVARIDFMHSCITMVP